MEQSAWWLVNGSFHLLLCAPDLWSGLFFNLMLMMFICGTPLPQIATLTSLLVRCQFLNTHKPKENAKTITQQTQQVDSTEGIIFYAVDLHYCIIISVVSLLRLIYRTRTVPVPLFSTSRPASVTMRSPTGCWRAARWTRGPPPTQAPYLYTMLLPRETWPLCDCYWGTAQSKSATVLSLHWFVFLLSQMLSSFV